MIEASSYPALKGRAKFMRRYAATRGLVQRNDFCSKAACAQRTQSDAGKDSRQDAASAQLK